MRESPSGFDEALRRFRSPTTAPTPAPAEIFSHAWERGLIIGFVVFMVVALLRLWSISYLIRKDRQEHVENHQEGVEAIEEERGSSIGAGYRPVLPVDDKYFLGPCENSLLWFPVNRIQMSLIFWVCIKIVLQLYDDGINCLFVAYTAKKAPDLTRKNLCIWGIFLVVMNLLLKPCYQVLKPVVATSPNLCCCSAEIQSGETILRSFFAFILGWLCWCLKGRDPGTVLFALREDVYPHCTRYIPGSFYNWVYILVNRRIEFNRQLPPTLPYFGRGRAVFLQMNYLIIVVTYSYLVAVLLSNSEYRTSFSAIYAYTSCMLLLPDLSISFVFCWTTLRYALLGLPSCILCCRPSRKLAIPRDDMWEVGLWQQRRKVSMFRIFAFFWDPNIIQLPTFLMRDRYCPMPPLSTTEPLLFDNRPETPIVPPDSPLDINDTHSSSRHLPPIAEEINSCEDTASPSSIIDKGDEAALHSEHVTTKNCPRLNPYHDSTPEKELTSAREGEAIPFAQLQSNDERSSGASDERNEESTITP